MNDRGRMTDIRQCFQYFG